VVSVVVPLVPGQFCVICPLFVKILGPRCIVIMNRKAYYSLAESRMARPSRITGEKGCMVR
jgi:hypothetical protein